MIQHSAIIYIKANLKIPPPLEKWSGISAGLPAGGSDCVMDKSSDTMPSSWVRNQSPTRSWVSLLSKKMCEKLHVRHGARSKGASYATFYNNTALGKRIIT